MTREQFQQIFIGASSEVADEFYPKNEYVTDRRDGLVLIDSDGHPVKTERSKRRGEYLRDQGVLFSKLSTLLFEEGILEN